MFGGFWRRAAVFSLACARTSMSEAKQTNSFSEQAQSDSLFQFKPVPVQTCSSSNLFQLKPVPAQTLKADWQVFIFVSDFYLNQMMSCFVQFFKAAPSIRFNCRWCKYLLGYQISYILRPWNTEDELWDRWCWTVSADTRRPELIMTGCEQDENLCKEETLWEKIMCDVNKITAQHKTTSSNKITCAKKLWTSVKGITSANMKNVLWTRSKTFDICKHLQTLRLVFLTELSEIGFELRTMKLSNIQKCAAQTRDCSLVCMRWFNSLTWTQCSNLQPLWSD